MFDAEAMERYKHWKANKEKLNSLITHKFAIENITEAFLLQMTRKCGKVIISP